MQCREAQCFVSALYDGERVPPEAAQHIDHCPACREQLREYAELGAELRLAASGEREEVLKPAWIPAPSPRKSFLRLSALTARVLVPRFTIGLAVAIIVALSVGLGLVNAQNRPLWFQFQLAPSDMPQPSSPNLGWHDAQAGYGEPMAWFWINRAAGKFSMAQVVAVVSITEIRQGQVRLTVKARHYASKADLDQAYRHLAEDAQEHEYGYVPGQTLKIPVDGGGALLLKGEVFDHQPKLAWGFPLEPLRNQMVLTHAVLLRGNQVLLGASGASAMISDDTHAIFLYVPGEGRFTFALQPFAGATKGEASWGELQFAIDGQQYVLFSASPITGGDQPHAVWVARNLNYIPSKAHSDVAMIFVRPLSQARQ